MRKRGRKKKINEEVERKRRNKGRRGRRRRMRINKETVTTMTTMQRRTANKTITTANIDTKNDNKMKAGKQQQKGQVLTEEAVFSASTIRSFQK